MLGLFYFAIKSLIESKSLKNALNKFWAFLNDNTDLSVKNYFVCLLVIIFLSFLFPVFRTFKRKAKKFTTNIPAKEQVDFKPFNHDRATVFFDNRIGDAFPCLRGLKWFRDPQIAADRLQILLKESLRFHYDSSEMSDPIWRYRGHGNFYIGHCKKLSKTKLLIDRYEFVIKEIAVYRDDRIEKNFVYIRVMGEKPVGVYEWLPEDIERHIKTLGRSREEYGLFENKFPVTREEYDDGSAVLKGKVIDTKGAELRIRYLSDYNFIMAAKQSTINSREFDKYSDDFLNGLLRDTYTFEQLLKFLNNLKDPIC